MPLIQYDAPLNVMVAVRGHQFDRTGFDAIFQSMPGIAATMVDQPLAAKLMNPEGMKDFDALVLYDMPGLDFGVADAPRLVMPDAAFRTGFEALLQEGKGIVALHHALAGWPAWPAYADYLGGSYLFKPSPLHGTMRLDSGYAHGIDYVAEVAAPGHPVLAGLPLEFAMRDELYLAEIFDDDVVPLLRARHDFVKDNFYSTTAALAGRMHDNAGWEHPPGSNLIGWTKRAINSPLVYLQPGDRADAYDNPHVRRLIENAIRWVVAESAAQYARPSVLRNPFPGSE